MTNTLASQVAGLKAGEWVKAVWTKPDSIITIKAQVKSGAGEGLLLGSWVIRYNIGTLHQDLTSITRVPRPIPSEPEVGSFALMDDGSHLFHKRDKTPYRWMLLYSDDDSGWDWTTWPEIYPHIIRLYTPSGDLVEGFECYEGTR